MPRVPTYDGPQVGQAQMQGGALQVQAVDLSGLGRSITGLGRDVQEIYSAERTRAIEASLNQAFAQSHNAETEMLYGYEKKGPEDPRESTVGVMQMEGGDLMAKAGEVRQKFQQRLDELENQLSTREAKSQYQRSKLSMLSNFDRHLQQRLGSQRERTIEESYSQYQQARINSLSSGAAVDFDGVFPRLPDGARDMQAIDDAMFALSINANQRARDPQSQFPDATRDDASRRLTTKAQQAVLASVLPILTEKDPKFAKAVAEKYVDAIPDKGRVFEHLDRAGFNAQAEENAQLAIGFGGAADPITGVFAGTLAEQEERSVSMLRKGELSKDQATNDESIRRVRAFFNQKMQLQRQKDDEVSSSLIKEMIAGNILTPTQLQADPRFQGLSGPVQSQLLNGFKKEGSVQRPEVMEKMQNMALSDNEALRDAFEKMPLSGEVVFLQQVQDPTAPSGFRTDTFKVVLTPKEFDEALKLQEKMKSKRLGENFTQAAHELTNEYIEKELIDKTSKYQFQNRLEEELNAFKADKKRIPLPEEQLKIADSLVKKVIVNRGVNRFGFQKTEKVRVFGIRKSELAQTDFRVKYSEIPQRDRDNIERDMKRMGQKVERNEVEKVYTKLLKGTLIPINK